MSSDVSKTLFPPRKSGDMGDPTIGLSDPNALSNAAKVLGDVWKNEETRFSNLNTRAVSALSASSLITTVLAFFSKNVLDTSATRLSSTQETVAKVGTYLALGLFALTALVIVLGVLRPGVRYIFGNNTLTGGQALSSSAIDQLVCEEYSKIYVALANRSRRKAYWLTFAYVTFVLAILSSVVATVLIIHGVPSAGPAPASSPTTHA